MLNYDDIRPYNNAEVPEKIKSLLSNPDFDKVLFALYREPALIEKIKMQLSMVQTVEQLQETFSYNLVSMLIQNTTKGVTSSGLENLDKKQAYLFISNHRDIIMDSALLNHLIFDNGMNTTQIAIGDNLLIYDWITHAVKLNRAFVVKRSLPPREMLTASKKLSNYIRDSITKENISVWIAQREGRTKNGDDLTQPALIKMLNMSNKENFSEGFANLKIVPLAISYEIEPCGISKVGEVIEKNQNEGFEKTVKDDLQSMAAGFLNPKDRVHFSFGEPIDVDFENPNSTEQQNKLIDTISRTIDKNIFDQFKLWPNNYIAFDRLNNNKEYNKFYSEQEEQEFEKLLDEALKTIGKDQELVTKTFLELYANPVINSLKQ